MVTTILWITITHLQQKTSLSHVRICVKAMMVMLKKVRVFWNIIKIKRISFIIYADTKSLLQKTHAWDKNK